MKEVHIKRFFLVLISTSVLACGYMPATSEVFSDQKEAYKKAHELPSLEVPPKLSGGQIKDEYDGANKARPIDSKRAVVRTTPIDNSKPIAEIFQLGDISYLLIHDSYRSAWRKTVSALEELDYDIEDKNREQSIIYLNISDGESNPSMLSSLSFWKKSATSVYLINLVEDTDSIAVKVQNEGGELVNDDVSKQIYNELLGKLVP